MASSGNKSSGWGSFLQQAVAGVEAKLDTILADEQDNAASPAGADSTGSAAVTASNTTSTIVASAKQQSPALSRTASTSSRTNDRLQQRLQRAIAAKAAAKVTPTTSPRHSIDKPRQSLDRTTTPRHSLDQPSRYSESDTRPPGTSPGEAPKSEETENEEKTGDKEAPNPAAQIDAPVITTSPATSPRPSADASTVPVTSVTSGSEQEDAAPSPEPTPPGPDDKEVIAALAAELDRLKSALQAKERQVSTFESRLQQTLSKLEAANKRVATTSSNEKDARKIHQLEETVASLHIEKRLEADRAKAHAAELKQQVNQAVEHAKKVELESKTEVIAMEGRLETIRARAEEATTGGQADSEAKLLRQLENLQAQYASASENWQGIEMTMLSRLTGIEAERDEAIRRESEMRKKARDAAARARRHEGELEGARISSLNLDEINRQHKAQVEKLTVRAENAEAAFSEAKAELEKQKQRLKEEKRDLGGDTERRTWLDELPPSFKGAGSRPQSPQLSIPVRMLSSDHLGTPQHTGKARKPSYSPSNCDASQSQGLPSRRPSALSYIQAVVSPAGTQATSPLAGSAFGDVEAPPAPPEDKDDMSEPIEMTASPTQVVPDVGSISTVAAGPSVQLVERMSAAIRRLESEKVAAKEELSRICSQRDEARSEIVALMKEVEGGRAAAEKVGGLESQVDEINQRYQTTLELLGEKSEMVDELRADVDDMKQMYRELVERTVR